MSQNEMFLFIVEKARGALAAEFLKIRHDFNGAFRVAP